MAVGYNCYKWYSVLVMGVVMVWLDLVMMKGGMALGCYSFIYTHTSLF